MDATVVVMGVSGTGKSTVGRLLAARLGAAFAEADEFHPAGNVVKMAAGRPLDDADRKPWLERIAGWLTELAATGERGVVACSALKREYRDLLRRAHPRLYFLHLDGDPGLAAERVAARTGHFMPATLIGSQFQALEPLQPDETGMVIDAALAAGHIVEQARAALEQCGEGVTL